MQNHLKRTNNESSTPPPRYATIGQLVRSPQRGGQTMRATPPPVNIPRRAPSPVRRARFTSARAFTKLFWAIVLTAIAVAGLSTALASPASSQTSQGTAISIPSVGACFSTWVSGDPSRTVRAPGWPNDLVEDCTQLLSAFTRVFESGQRHLPTDHPFRLWGEGSYVKIWNWPGITVETVNGIERITGIDLSNASSTNIGIDFSNTNIGDALPRISALKTLNLSGNNFSGEIPLIFTDPRLTELTTLDLSNSNLSGRVPSAFNSLTKLTVLRLQGNNLSGPLPLSEGDCSNGTFVDAAEVAGDNNDLRDDCEHLVDVQKNLAYTSSNRGLPSSNPVNSWGTGTNQKITSWEGVTITTVNGAQRVTGLDLSNQNLSGLFPNSVTRLRALEDLNLSNNNFFGLVFHCIGRLRLKKLNLSNNKFHDTGSTIRYIWLARNDQCDHPSGTVITTFTEIDLSNNRFANFPSDFTSITSLTKFDVSNNQLRGSIPGNIGTRLTNLQYFDISNNLLRGVLPGNTGSLKNVTTFNVSNNVLSGSVNALRGLARSAASPGSLTTLGICGNSFEGALPSELQADAADAPDLLEYPDSAGYDPVACQNDGNWFVRHIYHSREQIVETSSQFAERIGMRPDQAFYQWDSENQIWRSIPPTSSFGSVAPGTALAFRFPSDPDNLPSALRDSLNVADENMTLRLFPGWNIISMPETINRRSAESSLSFIHDSLIDCSIISGVIAVVRLSSQGEFSLELPCHPSGERRFTPLERIDRGDAVFVYLRTSLPVDVKWNSSSNRYETP